MKTFSNKRRLDALATPSGHLPSFLCELAGLALPFLRLCVGVFALLILGVAASFAAVLTAAYTTGADVPVTASSYIATGNTVTFTLNYTPTTGTQLTVVKNTGMSFISGTFDNLTQGQTVAMTYNGVTYDFVANYYGGTGNDLVLAWKATRIFAWGFNEYGQLGNNSTTNASVPMPVTA
ncbi:MAG: hypothetical protein RIQ79_607, partial [Verrucomicrobiota bacterium]